MKYKVSVKVVLNDCIRNLIMFSIGDEDSDVHYLKHTSERCITKYYFELDDEERAFLNEIREDITNSKPFEKTYVSNGLTLTNTEIYLYIGMGSLKSCEMIYTPSCSDEYLSFIDMILQIEAHNSSEQIDYNDKDNDVEKVDKDNDVEKVDIDNDNDDDVEKVE